MKQQNITAIKRNVISD